MQTETPVVLDPGLDLKPLFEPSSIAVIGASRREEAVGHAVFKNLLSGGYQGIIYPVNSKAKSIFGVRCYPSILDIPDEVDLAVLIIPAKDCVEVFKDCVKKNIKGAIVISAGFKEVGAQGAVLQKELGELAKKNRIPVIGPNCLGVINTDAKFMMNASFGQTMPKEGRLAFVSQSGALCTSVLDYAKGAGIGFSKFISMGNKASITELEIVEYLGRDDQTDVILMYLEDLTYPREMIELARKITGDGRPPKPILAIKSGRTLQGAKAASSHTGSLAGSDDVYSAAFAQAGILRAETIEELFDYAKAFTAKKLPQRNRVAIVTNAGGPGIMATDACVRYGLEMAPISEAGQAELKKHLPPTANFENPVDVIGDAQHGRYEAALKIVLREKKVDGIIVILTPQAMTDIEEIAEVVGKISKRSTKPILACFMGIVDVSKGEKVLEKWNVPHYRFPESSAKSFAGLTRYAGWVKRARTTVKTFSVDSNRAKTIIQKVLKEGRKNLVDIEVQSVLEAYGFPTLPVRACRTPEEAGKAAAEIGFPVVVKISSPDILHKFDVGGVALNLKTPEEVESAAGRMLQKVQKKQPEAKVFGVIVQKMARKGREVILGLKRDPHFGPIMMFGLGGTYVEVLKDVIFRIAPVRTLSVHNMIRTVKAYKLLQGVRGEKPADMENIAQCLQRLSQLAMECSEIEELDINPLMVYPEKKGSHVVDARIILS